MEMYCGSFGLLLTIFVAVVTCQSECDEAGLALAANADCLGAFLIIAEAVGSNGTILIGSSELNSYCQPSCRDLAGAVFTCDETEPDDASVDSINQLICSTDNGISCFDRIRSPSFTDLTNTFEASGVCDDIPDGQMCSSACQMALQELIVQGGCCLAATFDIAGQIDEGEELMQLMQQCPVDFSQAGTCVEIGGGGAINKAFLSVLLFGVISALALF